ncbi:MAG: hypothetical protein WD875_17945 [Pirellulales bacterium]
MTKTQLLDTLLGEHYLAIQAAIAVLDRPTLDLSRYAIAVVRQGEDDFVLLFDQSENVAARENLGVKRDGDAPLKASEIAALLANVDETETLDRIRGGSLRPIEKGAATFLTRFDADLAEYRIKLMENDKSLVAIFTDKDRKPGTKGHTPKRPGYEVEMKAKDLTVVRSNFLR